MVEFKVGGLAELQKRLEQLPAGIKTGGIILRGLAEGAKLVQSEAKRRAPLLKDGASIQPASTGPNGRKRRAYYGTTTRRRGAIRDNIVVQKKGVVDGQLVVIVRVRNRGYIFARARHSRGDRLRNPVLAGNPNYWWLVEFGTSKAAAQPFMRPAYESQKYAALERVKRAIAEEISTQLAKFPPMRIAA